MFSYILLVNAIVALVCQEVAAQLFGGLQNLPGGGSQPQIGHKSGTAWASLSQGHGSSYPLILGAGADYLSKQGHGLSGSLTVQPGSGGQGSLRGQLAVLNTPNHQVTAFAQHDRSFNRDFKPIAPQTNSVGVNYLNKNIGATAFVSGTQTQGNPARATVGASVPIFSKKNLDFSATGQTTFGHGMKPDHQFGIKGTYNF